MEFLTESGRIYAKSAEGQLLAEATFPTESPGTVQLDHVFVEDSLRGKGIGSDLVQAVVDFARAEGFHINPTCSFAVEWFDKHPECSDCLA